MLELSSITTATTVLFQTTGAVLSPVLSQTRTLWDVKVYTPYLEAPSSALKAKAYEWIQNTNDMRPHLKNTALTLIALAAVFFLISFAVKRWIGAILSVGFTGASAMLISGETSHLQDQANLAAAEEQQRRLLQNPMP